MMNILMLELILVPIRTRMVIIAMVMVVVGILVKNVCPINRIITL